MRTLLLVLWVIAFQACKGQKAGSTDISPNTRKLVGGGCDGCEIMYTGMPSVIDAVDTSAGWNGPGSKLLVSGRVLKADGRTAARDIILYYWQTDHRGYYSPAPGLPKAAARHGHIRGWVKTDSLGRYAIYTILPAPYPGERIPAHIHIAVKEPGMNEYYIDDMVFDDDPLLIGNERKKLEGRGGSGILRLEKSGLMEVGERNIILGLNIPDHPSMIQRAAPGIGDEQQSFMPFHVWGPDKGSRACPVCKYGRYTGAILFVGRAMRQEQLKDWLRVLEEESERRKPYFKAYVVWSGEWTNGSELAKLGSELGIRHLALTLVPSFSDTASEVYLNKIDPADTSTIVIYQKRIIVDRRTNLIPDHEFRIPD